jgi:hypothetical protein
MTTDFKDWEPLIFWAATVILFAVLVTRLAIKGRVRVAQRLGRWAKENGIEIVSSERRIFFKGPYFWRRSYTVYRVVGRSRSKDKESIVAWLDLHSPLFGKDWEEVSWGDGRVTKLFESN